MSRARTRRRLTILGVLTAAGLAGASAALAVTTLTAATSRIVVFKDGYCMVVKKVTGRIDSDRRAVLADVPSTAALGTFWMRSAAAKPTRMVVREKTVRRDGRSETQKEIELEFDPTVPEGEAELTLSYFSPGIRWIPTYRIGLGKDGKAELLMQAEILDELDEFENIPVDLVVGVPNFRFKDIISPLSLQASLANPLQQAAPDLMGQSLSNSLFTQRAGERPGTTDVQAGGAIGNAPVLPPSLIGEGAQDLFVYTIPRLTLRAGERAAVPILSAAVPFRHLYSWDVHLQRSASEGEPAGGVHPSPMRLLTNDVWHEIEITNSTKLPLTTGAALAMDGDLPIAQELLTYTAAGGKTEMPLTVAVDVRGDYSEAEVSREPNGIRFDGSDYVRVTKKGTLTIANSKKEAITLRVTAQFGGNCTQASDNGKIVITDFTAGDWESFRGHPALVGHSTVTWQLTLKAGQTAEVTCLYHYFTR